MARTQTDLEDQAEKDAQALLDMAGDALPGLDADTKVTINGTTVATAMDFALGERVEFRVVGYVNFVGDELLENEGKRHVVKVKSSLIEVVDGGTARSED